MESLYENARLNAPRDADLIYNGCYSIVKQYLNQLKRALLMEDMYCRTEYNAKYGYSIVTKEFIEDLFAFSIKKSTYFIDLLSGTGYISKALHNRNDSFPLDNRPLTIISVDDKSWHGGKWWRTENGNSSVIKADAVEWLVENKKQIKEHNPVILVSWPPYEDPLMHDIAKALKKMKFKGTLLYIGEEPGGCTADSNFFKTFKIEESDELNEHHLRFTGLHDYVYEVTL